MNYKHLHLNLLLGMLMLMLMPTTALADEIPVAVFSDDGKTMTFTYADESKVDSKTTFKLGEWTRKDSIDTLVVKVLFDQSFAKARPTSTSYWFFHFNKVKSIDGLKYLNTSEVTDMSFMFSDCNLLKDIDVSGFNTDRVTNMQYMFCSCWALAHLDVSNFNTENVSGSLRYMFFNCSSLKELDVSKFKTDKVNNMVGMFGGCSSLTKLDVSGFNTDNVVDMQEMFNRCSSLT